MSLNKCLDVALEGQQLFERQNYSDSIRCFENALKISTDDWEISSAIYNQMANAHYMLGNYKIAAEYHQIDLNLCRENGDVVSEAKACGNLCNCYKIIGNFERSLECANRQVFIAEELKDDVMMGRASYNLGNVHHMRAKPKKDGDEYDKELLFLALPHYKDSLNKMKQTGDRINEGKVRGNLGDIYFLTGEWDLAISNHKERLSLAQEFGNKSAEMRAYANLGNIYLTLGKLNEALTHYKRVLNLCIHLGDHSFECLVNNTLGRISASLHQFPAALSYHLKQLELAKLTNDKVNECRAYWSIAHAYCKMNNLKNSLEYSYQHLLSSNILNDFEGVRIAKGNIEQLHKRICLSSSNERVASCEHTEEKENHEHRTSVYFYEPSQADVTPVVTPVVPSSGASVSYYVPSFSKHMQKTESEDFGENLSSINSPSSSNLTPIHQQNALTNTINKESPANITLNKQELIDNVFRFQSNRMNDQRVSLEPDKLSRKHNSTSVEDNIYEIIERCQSSRLDDQRSSFPPRSSRPKSGELEFYNAIQRMQTSDRMNDQRTELPPLNTIKNQ